MTWMKDRQPMRVHVVLAYLFKILCYMYYSVYHHDKSVALLYNTFFYLKCTISTPSTRKGSHAESKASIAENSVSFQLFLILLYSITLGSESQISVFKQCLSNT